MELIIRGLDLPPGNKQALLTRLQKSREHLRSETPAPREACSAPSSTRSKPTLAVGSIRIRSTGSVSMAELRMDAIDDAAAAD